MNIARLTLFVLWATFVWGIGCSAQKHDPALQGWKHYFNAKLDKAVIDDYRDYIQKLPPEERKFVSDTSVEPLENDAGGHAVKIEIPLNGTYWEHLLIYEKENKRIKTLKYKSGQYRS